MVLDSRLSPSLSSVEGCMFANGDKVRVIDAMDGSVNLPATVIDADEDLVHIRFDGYKGIALFHQSGLGLADGTRCLERAD